MQACSLLLGHPWEFDTDAIHYGRSNKYTLVHNRKKITLLPLTPNEIVQCDRAIAETARRESEIRLQGHSLLGEANSYAHRMVTNGAVV